MLSPRAIERISSKPVRIALIAIVVIGVLAKLGLFELMKYWLGWDS